MTDLKIGFVGVGGRSKIASYAHKPDKGLRVIAGADIDDIALRRFAQKYGPHIKLFNDYGKLISEVELDAVFICTPDYLHEEQTIAFLEAGIPVFLEKPMALTLEGCDRILETSYHDRVRLYIGHNMRHMAFVLKMKELIDSDAIGEVKTAWCRHFIGRGGDYYFKDWHAEREKVSGLLVHKASHDIDVLHWLCGGNTVKVNAMGTRSVYHKIEKRRRKGEKVENFFDSGNWPPSEQRELNPVIDVEDVSMAQMLLDNGALVSYQQCHFTPDNWRNYTIIGTRGRIENFGNGHGKTIIKLWNRRDDYHPEGDFVYDIPEIDESDYHHDEEIVNEFLRFVIRGCPVTVTPLDARNSIAACSGATSSLRRGGVVIDIPPVRRDIHTYFETYRK